MEHTGTFALRNTKPFGPIFQVNPEPDHFSPLALHHPDPKHPHPFTWRALPSRELPCFHHQVLRYLPCSSRALLLNCRGQSQLSTASHCSEAPLSRDLCGQTSSPVALLSHSTSPPLASLCSSSTPSMLPVGTSHSPVILPLTTSCCCVTSLRSLLKYCLLSEGSLDHLVLNCS